MEILIELDEEVKKAIDEWALGKRKAVGVDNGYKLLEAVRNSKNYPRGQWEHGREISREYIGNVVIHITYQDWHCSNCNYIVKEEASRVLYNFCPNCGADMRKVVEDGKIAEK